MTMVRLMNSNHFYRCPLFFKEGGASVFKKKALWKKTTKK